MEQDNLIGVFGQEKVCEYKGRRYYVRDNGAVYRQCQDDGKTRKWDEQWTFGKLDPPGKPPVGDKTGEYAEQSYHKSQCRTNLRIYRSIPEES